MSFNVQGAKGLTIPEGTVKTIHDKDNRLLWGAVGYNTKYAGDTFQQTIAGNNLFDRANAKENTLLKWLDAGDNTDTGSIVASNHIPVSEGDRYTSNYAMTLFFYDSSDKYIGVLLPDEVSVGKSAGAYVKTFVVPSGYNIAKMCIEYRKGQGDPANPQDMVSVTDIMCNLGSSVLPYEPYVGGIPSPNPDYPQDINVVTGEQTVTVSDGNSNSQPYTISLGALELCKIGNYQDYIWKDGDTWKIHKETSKVVFDSTNVSKISQNPSNPERYLNASGNTIFVGLALGNPSYQSCCSHYSFVRNGTAWQGVGKCGFDGTGTFWFMDSRTSLSTIRAWLSSEGVHIYYPIATSTDTAITDETLISQLNAIEEWMTRYGYVGTVFGNLPMIIGRTTI